MHQCSIVLLLSKKQNHAIWFKLCQFVWAQEVCSSHVCVTIRPVMSPPPPYHPPLNWPPYTIPPPQPTAYPPPPWATLLNATYSPPPPPSTLNYSLFIQIWFANHTIQQWFYHALISLEHLKGFVTYEILHFGHTIIFLWDSIGIKTPIYASRIVAI